jgi:hypothetical protein
MKKNPAILALSVLALIASAFFLLRAFLASPKFNPIPQSSSQSATEAETSSLPTPTPDEDNGLSLVVYTNQAEGYSIKVPSDWQKTVEKKGLVTFTPRPDSEPLGSMKEISIMTGTPFSAKQLLSTQAQLADWAGVAREDRLGKSNFRKDQQEMIDGAEGITVMDVDSKQDEWNMVTWLRKENRNYYVSIKGGPIFNGVDIGVYPGIVSTMRIN